jgi:hypothetical protein
MVILWGWVFLMREVPLVHVLQRERRRRGRLARFSGKAGRSFDSER